RKHKGLPTFPGETDRLECVSVELRARGQVSLSSDEHRYCTRGSGHFGHGSHLNFGAERWDRVERRVNHNGQCCLLALPRQGYRLQLSVRWVAKRSGRRDRIRGENRYRIEAENDFSFAQRQPYRVERNEFRTFSIDPFACLHVCERK